MHTVWCGVLQTDLNASLCCNYKHGNTGAVRCTLFGFKHQFLIMFYDHGHILNDFIPRSETNDQNVFLKKASVNLHLLWLIFEILLYYTYFLFVSCDTWLISFFNMHFCLCLHSYESDLDYVFNQKCTYCVGKFHRCGSPSPTVLSMSYT